MAEGNSGKRGAEISLAVFFARNKAANVQSAGAKCLASSSTRSSTRSGFDIEDSKELDCVVENVVVFRLKSWLPLVVVGEWEDETGIMLEQYSTVIRTGF